MYYEYRYSLSSLVCQSARFKCICLNLVSMNKDVRRCGLKYTDIYIHDGFMNEALH